MTSPSGMQEVGSFQDRLNALQEENVLLKEQSEDLLLLHMVAENIESQDTAENIISVGLERISTLKKIPLSACCAVDGVGSSVLRVHFSQGSAELRRDAITVPAALVPPEMGEAVAISGKEAVQAGITFPGLPQSFAVSGLLIVPFRTRQIPSGFFLFATDSPKGSLNGVKVMLTRSVDLIASRVDRLGLLEELQQLNRYLDRKVDSRTQELVEANQSLQREINDRRRAELALRETEARFKLLIEHAGDAVMLHDMDGRLIDVNQRACDSLGYSRAELLQLSVPDLDMEFSTERIRSISESMRPGDAVTLEGTHRRRDGTRFPVEIRLGAMDMCGHQVFIALARDMTERRKLETQLQHSQKMEAVGRLAGGVAHDFNNLLSGIIGYSELTLGRLGENHPIRPYIESVCRSGKRAADLTRQLLSFSRKQVLETEVTNLNTIIDNIKLMLERLIGEHIEIQIETNNVANVMADPGQIEQVIVNLAVNARDAMPEGGKLRIETREEIIPEQLLHSRREMRPGTYVVMTVSDTGMGMTPETQARVFEPFFTTKEVGKGTGLGLSMVYGIVKQHRGHINLQSELGQGTSFEIFIPVCGGIEQAQEEAADAAVMPEGRETILVVDDEADIRKLVRDVLAPLGYQILDASCGDEAMTLIENDGERIDLMLTDIVMPRMTGLQLAEKARKIRPAMKAVFMSGYAEDVIYKGRSGRQVLQHLITKPLLPRTVAERIRTVLDEVPFV